MQLYNIRGGDKKDLENKKYTIGVGISLGNKWFTVENIMELIKWALDYSKDNVIIYVADSIHAINIEVRNQISFQKALLKANNLGDRLIQEVKERAEKELLPQEIERLVYLKWDQIINEKFREKITYLNDLYKKNKEFKHAIHSIIMNHVSREKRSFSGVDIDRFGQYIIEELPEILTRVEMGNTICDAYAYPHDGELPKFVEQLQKGEIFPEIKENIMDTEPKVFLEVR